MVTRLSPLSLRPGPRGPAVTPISSGSTHALGRPAMAPPLLFPSRSHGPPGSTDPPPATLPCSDIRGDFLAAAPRAARGGPCCQGRWSQPSCLFSFRRGDVTLRVRPVTRRDASPQRGSRVRGLGARPGDPPPAPRCSQRPDTAGGGTDFLPSVHFSQTSRPSIHACSRLSHRHGCASHTGSRESSVPPPPPPNGATENASSWFSVHLLSEGR